MNGYQLSARARLDLLDIWNDIAERDIDTAGRILADLQSAMLRLSEFPGIGHRRADVPDPRFRFWRVHCFIVAYLPGARPLSSNRVVHGHRDFRKLFPRQRRQ